VRKAKSSLELTFQETIECFCKRAKELTGVYDILIRGGATHSQEQLIENWSDLDLSIIVEDIKYKNLEEIRALYQGLKENFPYKLSLTIVTRVDFFSSYHHHGMKPIYYGYQLSTSKRFSNEKQFYMLNSRFLKENCFSNIAYLIHDLRSRYLQLDLNNVEKLKEFLCHSVKRGKHIAKNSIFVMTGYMSENICISRFKECFPNANPEFPEDLNRIKVSYNSLPDEMSTLALHIENIINSIEIIYDDVLRFFQNNELEFLAR
jgi:hypothetical protein